MSNELNLIDLGDVMTETKAKAGIHKPDNSGIAGMSRTS